VRKNYQRKEHKSNHKLEAVLGQELLMRMPLPMAEVWTEMQAKVELSQRVRPKPTPADAS
jgi:hypothetical protein